MYFEARAGRICRWAGRLKEQEGGAGIVGAALGTETPSKNPGKCQGHCL